MNVAELLYPGRGKGFLRIRLGFPRRIGKFLVNCLDYFYRSVGVINADRVPSDSPLPERLAFIEISPVKPELGGVIGRARAVIDGTNIEFPDPRNERASNGNAIADFPAKPLGRVFPDHGSLSVSDKGPPLIIGDNEFRKHLVHSVGIDRELREEIAFVLIDSAEPVRECDLLYARDFQQPVSIGERQGLDDRSPVNCYQAVRARDIDTPSERPAHHEQQAKQKQRYREGAHCQHGADLLAKQIGEDEGQEFHEAPTSFLAASTRAPFSRCNVVCARFATSGSWVTIKTVLPYSATKR